MKKIKTRDIIFVCVGVAFLIFVGVSMNLSKDAGKKIADEFFVNAKGQKWTLPDTPVFEFTASSGSYPKFLAGKIEPPKVKVGETQKLMIRVASPSPIKSVKAITDTDTKTQELELQLVESKALSGNYFRNQPYLVNEKNELVINNTNATYAEKAVEQIVAKAEAQALVEYTYEGSWVVNDTHTETYHTKFLAEAESGEKNILTLAWSDPVCEFSPTGRLLNAGGCSFDNSIEGFDGGDITIDEGQTVTLKDGGIFMWNGDEGKKITVNGTFILSGGSIAQGGIYYDDVDQDTWPASITFTRACEGQCTPQIRVKDSPSRPWNPDFNTYPNGGIDCMDTESTVNPGAPFHADQAGPNNWDYNCSGIVEGGWERAEETTVPNVYHVIYAENKSTNHLANPWTIDKAGCGNYSRGEQPQLCNLRTFQGNCPAEDFEPTKGPRTSVENGFIGVLQDCTVVKCLGPSLQSYCR